LISLGAFRDHVRSAVHDGVTKAAVLVDIIMGPYADPAGRDVRLVGVGDDLDAWVAGERTWLDEHRLDDCQAPAVNAYRDVLSAAHEAAARMFEASENVDTAAARAARALATTLDGMASFERAITAAASCSP